LQPPVANPEPIGTLPITTPPTNTTALHYVPMTQPTAASEPEIRMDTAIQTEPSQPEPSQPEPNAESTSSNLTRKPT
jgi:hypothetical protein